MSIASWTSPPASAFTFPISRVIRSVSSSLWARRSSAKRKRMLPRSGAGTRRQSSNAALAAATARSTSAALERGKLPRTSPVAGAIESNVSAAIWRRLVGGVGLRERPRDAPAAPVTRDAPLGELRARQLVAAVRPVFAAVDDHRHVRVLAVVVDELVVELAFELARDDAVDHGLSVTPTLEARNVRNDPAVVLQVRVPLGERLIEVGRIVAALGEPDRRRVGRDAVLLPRDLPRGRDDDVGVDAGQGVDRDARRAEALRDAADGAPVLRGVEAVGRLDDRELGLRQAAQERLARHRRLGGAAHAEEAGEREAGPPAVGRDRRRRRRSLLQPAVFERRVQAELADVDERVVSVRRVARRALAHQQRPLADRATAVDADSGHTHAIEGSSRKTLQPAVVTRPERPPSPSWRPRSISEQCEPALLRSGETPCGSRRGRPSSRSATASR